MPEFITKEKLGEVIASKPEYQTPKGKAAVTRMLVKQGHEIEGINASFSGLNAAANVFPSLYELGKGIVKMVVDYDEKKGVELRLDDTLAGLSNAAIGGIANLVDKAGGDAKNSVGADIVAALGGDVGKQQEAARGIYNFYQQRYGSTEKLKETVERDPAGFLADVAGLFSGGASAAKGLGKAAQVAGATGLASKIATAQTFLTRTAQAVEPLGIVPKAVSATASKANDVLGITSKLRELPSKAFGRDLFTGAQLEGISNKTFTKDVGERLANWGITGSLDDMTRQLGEIETKSAAAVDNALAGVKTLHKSKSVENTLDVLQESLAGLRDKESQALLAEVNTLRNKNAGSGLTLTEVNRTKRLLGKLKGEAAFRAQGGAKATNTGRELSNLYSEVRQFIEDEAGRAGVKNIRELNNQNQFAMLTRKGLEKMQAGSAKRDNFTGVLVESMAAGYTGGWSLLYSIPARLIRSPQFQRDLATAVKLMDDADFKVLEGGIKFSRKEGKLERAARTAQRTARITAPARARLDQVMAQLRRLYPEVRVLTAGQAQE